MLDENEPMVWRGSGDVGQVLPEQGICCVGRYDDQIKRMGKRMDLAALNSVRSVYFSGQLRIVDHL